MIMSTGHDPLTRKRSFSETGGPETKKSKNESDGNSVFSEKMYSAYVKSAFESLDKVCIFSE